MWPNRRARWQMAVRPEEKRQARVPLRSCRKANPHSTTSHSILILLGIGHGGREGMWGGGGIALDSAYAHGDRV